MIEICIRIVLAKEIEHFVALCHATHNVRIAQFVEIVIPLRRRSLGISIDVGRLPYLESVMLLWLIFGSEIDQFTILEHAVA